LKATKRKQKTAKIPEEDEVNEEEDGAGAEVSASNRFSAAVFFRKRRGAAGLPRITARQSQHERNRGSIGQ